jgi:hypothetical protein
MINIIYQLLVTVVFYFILMFLSTNLLGFFVRGVFISLNLESLKKDTHEFIKQEIKKTQKTNKWITIIAFLLIIFYLYLLYHFGNIGVSMIAILFMIARLPDLLWEIKTGTKIISEFMPKGKVYLITSLILWLLFPLLFYFLYYF